MIKKVVRLFWDFEKEEKWINTMAAKGLLFKKVILGVIFLFEKGMPSEYIYRIELLKNLPSHPESKTYILFLEETGAELVATHRRYVYFRKKSKEGNFDLYSDIDSKIRHYKRFCYLLGMALTAQIIIQSFYLLVIIDFSTAVETHVSFFIILLINLLGISIVGIPLYRFFQKIKNLKKQKEIME